MSDRLEALLALAASENRICPVPPLWDKFWKLIGAPEHGIGPPLILAGWAFSSDRQKRGRFQAQISYAAASGLLDEAERFIQGLRLDEWHTCAEGDLDYSFGGALSEDLRRKDSRLDTALDVYEDLREATDSAAFSKDNLARTIDLLGWLFGLGIDAEARMRQLRQSLATYEDRATNWDPLRDGTPPAVVEEVERMLRARRVELAVLEIYLAAGDADGRRPGEDPGREEIDAFVDDMFERSESPGRIKLG